MNPHPQEHAPPSPTDVDVVIDAAAETALVRRARDGEAAAFEGLLARHEQRVRRLARRLLGHREDAEDAAQEVFLRLHRHLDRIDPERPLAPWLHRVTVNVCRDAGRHRARRDALPLDDAEPSALEARGLGPMRRAELAEQRRMVEAGLAALTEKERTAVVLRDLEGYSAVEVAAMLGVSAVTVRTYLYRARIKMQLFRRRWTSRGALAAAAALVVLALGAGWFLRSMRAPSSLPHSGPRLVVHDVRELSPSASPEFALPDAAPPVPVESAERIAVAPSPTVATEPVKLADDMVIKLVSDDIVIYWLVEPAAE